jgi:DHA1 family multidrug resistance protein-like MFS transporter
MQTYLLNHSMKKHLLVLLGCLFVVSIGFGITLPVLPFYTQRLGLATGVSPKLIAVHIGLLTSIFPLMQLLFAPIWGRMSDRFGRKPLVLLGIAGTGVSLLLFGLSTSLWQLYGARILGGILASAVIPAATAYAADATSEDQREKGMAWLGTAASLGAIAGAALGGLVIWRNWHIHSSTFGSFVVDGFSIPFFLAAVLALMTLLVAIRWLPESLTTRHELAGHGSMVSGWKDIGRNIWKILGLTTLSHLGLALFETVFVLYSQSKLGYGPAQVAFGFMTCGLVMALFQGFAVGYLSGRVSEMVQLAIGFNLMGVGIALLLFTHALALTLGAISVLALGVAFITPNLSALTSKRSGGNQMGAGLGLQTSAGYLGQTTGPFLGAVLFAWIAGAPYLLTAIALVSVGIAIGRKALMKPVVLNKRILQTD